MISKLELLLVRALEFVGACMTRDRVVSVEHWEVRGSENASVSKPGGLQSACEIQRKCSKTCIPFPCSMQSPY